MEKNQNLYVVIMAGGIGSRFWPASRENYPKQFLDILNIGKSLLQLTVSRFSEICPEENIYVVTNEKYGKLVREQVTFLSDEQILEEPIGRNTAPCIAYAAYKIGKKNSEAVMVVAPSDHSILNESKFIETIQVAISEAENTDKLITLGIKPHKPETGYGYIQYIHSDRAVKRVKTFTEKPELEMAKTFVASGDFVWNSGMFIWSVKTIIHSFETLMPDLSEVFGDISKAFYTPKEAEAIKTVYYQCRAISIDYGIMEKADSVFVIPSEFGWSDLGSWSALHDISFKDENNNVIAGNALTFNVKDSIIKCGYDKLIVVDGLKGYLIAEHDNAILICPKDNERKFRQLFNEIKKSKPDFL